MQNMGGRTGPGKAQKGGFWKKSLFPRTRLLDVGWELGLG